MLTLALLPCRFLAIATALILILSEQTQARFFRESTKTIEVCPDLLKASQIAEANARPRSTKRCWRYVKRALVEANVVDSYPEGIAAKNAGSELTQHFGFTKLAISNPKDAPVGAILVYGGKGYGHVEFRTEDGYVSDFKTTHPSKRPLTGVYVKASST
jgi:hypothetical protein